MSSTLLKQIKTLLNSKDINSARQGLELLLALDLDNPQNTGEASKDLALMKSRFLDFGIVNNKWGPNRISEYLPFKFHYKTKKEMRIQLFFAVAAIGPLKESLKILDLSNDLPFLPEEISTFSALEDLDLSLNPLPDFPRQILGLSLKRLGLSGLGWRKVPTALLEMTSLESIDLSLNPLEAFPTELAALPRLEVLDLSGARIKFLPDLSSFESLEVLALAGNDIPPDAFDQLPPRLRSVKLSTKQWQLADALCELNTGKQKVDIHWVLPDNCPNCTKFFELRITARSNENRCPSCNLQFFIREGEQHDWFIDGDSLKEPDELGRKKLIASDYSQEEHKRRIAAYPRLLNSPHAHIRRHAVDSLEDTWPDEEQKIRALLALEHKDVGLKALRNSRLEDIRPYWHVLEAIFEDPCANNFLQHYACEVFNPYPSEADLGRARLASVSAKLFKLIGVKSPFANSGLSAVIALIIKKGLDIPDDCLAPATRVLILGSTHKDDILSYAKRGEKESSAMCEALLQFVKNPGDYRPTYGFDGAVIQDALIQDALAFTALLHK